MPPGFAVTTAAASQVPKIAPMIEVQRDRVTLFFIASLYPGESQVCLKLSQVNGHERKLLSVVSDPWTTT
jgi:hypothetical protein